MNRTIRSISQAIAMAGTLALSSGASAGAINGSFTVPFGPFDNPCTIGFDNVNGSANVHFVAQLSNGTGFIKFNAEGAGTDLNGVGYQVHFNSNFQLHDPVPATLYDKVALISQGNTPNFTVTTAIHVDGQGNVDKFELFNAECRG